MSHLIANKLFPLTPDIIINPEDDMRHGQDWADFLRNLDEGNKVEITQGEYDYFLCVLPPVHIGGYLATLDDGTQQRAYFGFAEGSELVKAFWKSGGKIYCQKTKEMNPYG